MSSRDDAFKGAIAGAFFSGLWVAIGVNPYLLIARAPVEGLASLESVQTDSSHFMPPETFVTMISVVLLMIFIVSLLGSVIYGRIPGAIAFTSAFLSGAIFLSNHELGALLLIVSTISALLAFQMYGSQSQQGGRGGRPVSTRNYR